MTDSPSQPLQGGILDVTCIILAGGRSSRMGENKAFVSLGGGKMIDHILKVCRGVFAEIIIATRSPEQFQGYEAAVVRDEIENAGPLGGIYTGLRAATYRHAFCVACDMPLVNERLVRHLLRYRFDYDAVVPRMGRFVEPLHAVYSKECEPIIMKSVRSGILRARDFLDRLRVLYCEGAELARMDPSFNSFTNVNTKEELKIVADQWKRG